MAFEPVYNLTPKLEVVSENKNKLTYFLRENLEEIYAKLIVDSNLDENRVKFEIIEYNKKYLQVENIVFFLKTLFIMILDLSLNRIEIVNFPIDKKTWQKCFNRLKSFLDNKITIQKKTIDKGNFLKNIVFTIKRTKKNHYIPQGYLKSFSCNPTVKSKNKKILVFEKDKEKLLERNGKTLIKINNIAFQSHFYSIRFEQILAKEIEPGYFKIIGNILENQSCESLSLEQKVAILKFIFSLYLRTPDSREHFKELTKKSIRKLYFEGLRLKGIDLDENDIKVDYNDLMLRMKISTKILFFF